MNFVKCVWSPFIAVAACAVCFDVMGDGVDEVIPSFYQEPGLSRNREHLNQQSDERIDPFTGKLQWHFVDIFVPGNGGLDLKVQRSYSSMNELLDDASPIGIGWTMHFGRVMRKATTNMCALGVGPTSNPVLELADGSRHVLYDSLDGTYAVSTGLWRADCNNASPGGLIIHSPDGTRYEMTTQGPMIGSNPSKWQQSWYTTRIVDRNGNTMDFTYVMLSGATSMGVQSVATSDGRSLTFNYSGDHLSSIAGPGGTWSYGHTLLTGVSPNYYFLTSATRPDGQAWSYQYNTSANGPGMAPAGGYSMKKVTYPTGAQVNYTYGFATFAQNPNIPISTVITNKQSDDGAWTYAYTPATEPIPPGGMSWTISDGASIPNLDRTRIEGPEGHYVYFHFGYNSVTSGEVYLIGALAGKVAATAVEGQAFASAIEAYSWGRFVISGQTNLRPGGTMAFDTETATPYIVGKNISRGTGLHTTVYSNFDDYKNPQTITETGSASRTRAVTYFTDASKWILHQKKDETLSTTGAITRSFDANGNMTSENRYGVSTDYAYSGGDVTSKTDARGNSVSYGNHKRGIPQSESHPQGVSISRTVSDAGNVLTESDGTGATTGYTYDGLNRVTGITHATGNPVSVTWGANTRTVTRGGYSEEVTYDSFGRQTQARHTDSTTGTVVTQNYRNDVLGRRTFTSYPNSSVGTGMAFDVIGTLLVVRHEYDPNSGSHSTGRSFNYNGNGVVTMSNETGVTYTYTYRYYDDPDERHLLSIAAPLAAASITMERNGVGQLTSATQDGKTRTYGYNGQYFLTTMTDPEVGTTTFGRDGVGNMTTRQVGASPTTTYTYDGRNRVTAIAYPGGTPSVAKTYFKDDKVATIDNGIALRSYTYDGNKNLKTETLAVSGQAPFAVQYDYNGNDALNLMTYGSGKTISYSPDGFGRATRAAPYVTAVTHHPNGQMASMTYANGVTTTVGLNGRQWPDAIAIAGAANMFNTSYTYDGLGNVLGISDSVDPTYNRHLEYDEIDRLVVADGAWAGGTTGAFTYDGRGNIKSQLLGSQVLNYNYDAASNRLASISGTKSYAFTYDVYGNVTGNGTKSFGYNDASNLRCVDCGTPGETTYDYDGASMRVRTTKNGVSTYFVYGSGGNLLWERVPGVSLKEYIYLDGKQVAVREKTGS
ncbi:hypothetical protein DSM104443_00788 [Usitatibacter rugosus]|uniref:YD repeat-containing protein n=1 Tax=Usitatibacter rugosus TaxID=2732067 RepID=A0A6M4GSD5_9PROT|nr:RHS repeat protein [Usitatibacter rugosus]QJR09738.1 hypothetical protein DSM104443_00788 [Usitatibacter rugosus]